MKLILVHVWPAMIGSVNVGLTDADEFTKVIDRHKIRIYLIVFLIS
jgi:hypothetical protein